MSIDKVIFLLDASSALYKMHKDTPHEWEYSKEYVTASSVLDSGWDYHWVSSTLHGVAGRIQKKRQLKDVGCLSMLNGFFFMSDDVLERYFSEPDKCPIFIGHLFLQQKVLEICLSIIEG